MTVLEAIEQLTAERKEKRIEPLNIVFRSIYDKLSISWFEMVEELERLKEAGLIHIGDTPKDRYAKLKIYRNESRNQPNDQPGNGNPLQPSHR
ncbi:hypothetical protein [Alistipes indistinctus]|jgi:hypothetical protein|uniref:hypothetical protein n=1 Tax=Alistipes indistinctus TaxID=626932 RepID=UPI0036F2A540